MGRSTDSALERVFRPRKIRLKPSSRRPVLCQNTRSYIVSNLLPIFRRCKHSKRALTAIVGMGRSPGSGSSSLAAFPEFKLQWPYWRGLPLQWRDRFGFSEFPFCRERHPSPTLFCCHFNLSLFPTFCQSNSRTVQLPACFFLREKSSYQKRTSVHTKEEVLCSKHLLLIFCTGFVKQLHIALAVGIGRKHFDAIDLPDILFVQHLSGQPVRPDTPLF